jgi:hypothetical protein
VGEGARVPVGDAHARTLNATSLDTSPLAQAMVKDGQALDDHPNREPSPNEPWAKTSSGDKEKMRPEGDE